MKQGVYFVLRKIAGKFVVGLMILVVGKRRYRPCPWRGQIEIWVSDIAGVLG